MTGSSTPDPPATQPSEPMLRACAVTELQWLHVDPESLPASFMQAWIDNMLEICRAGVDKGEDLDELLEGLAPYDARIIWERVTGRPAHRPIHERDAEMLSLLARHGVPAAPRHATGQVLLERAIARRGIEIGRFPAPLLQRIGAQVEACATPAGHSPWFRSRAAAAEAFAALMATQATGVDDPALGQLSPDLAQRAWDALVASGTSPPPETPAPVPSPARPAPVEPWASAQPASAVPLLQQAIARRGVDPRRFPSQALEAVSAELERGVWRPIPEHARNDLGVRRGTADLVARFMIALLEGEPLAGNERARRITADLRGILRAAGLELPDPPPGQ